MRYVVRQLTRVLFGAFSMALPWAMMSQFAYATTSQNQTIQYKLTIQPSLSVSCPNADVDFGTWGDGASPSSQRIACEVKQNRRTGTLLITSSTASNTMSLQESNSGHTYPVHFSDFQFSSGAVDTRGGFQSGIQVTNPASQETSTFSFQATPAASIPRTQMAGTYSGVHMLIFSLI